MQKIGYIHLHSSTSCLNIFLTLIIKWFLLDKRKSRENVLIISKGHAAPALYVILAEFGLIEGKELDDIGKINSKLQTHVTKEIPLVGVSSGSLGQGLSIGNGIALASKIDKKDVKVYVVLGDGELDEGQIWEAALTAAHYKLDNIIAIIDRNGKQLTDSTEKIKAKEPLKDKWRSFGWKVIEVKNNKQLLEALLIAEEIKGYPVVIIMKNY